MSTAGSGLTLTDTDSVTGADTASDPSGSYGDDTAPGYSVLVEIPGPVSQVTVTHSQDGPLTSDIKVSDIFFDSHPDDTPGEDTLMGDDALFGGDGDALIEGGSGNDTINGGAGVDTMLGGTVNFLDTDGDVTGSMTFQEIEKIIPCFTPGTVGCRKSAGSAGAIW